MLVTIDEAQRKLFEILENVNKNHDIANVVSSNHNNDAVIMGKQDYDSLATTLHLVQGGILDDIKIAAKNGYVDITDGIDWG